VNWRLLKTGNENDIEFQGDGSKATFTTPQMTELILEFN
jgi:hypothetical protein